MTTIRRREQSEAGFTLIEMLVATAIIVTVTGAVFALMNPSQGMFVAQREVSDMQQRLRLGVDTLTKDIMMAGAGTYTGAGTGSLGNYFAAIVPYRMGNINQDPPGSLTTDRITVMYVPPTSAQTTIRDPMPNQSSEIKTNTQPGCPVGDDLCGFHQGMTVLIFDETGAFETFQITEVQSSALHLQHRGQDFQKAYDAGAHITQIAAYTYWLKSDDATGTYQLMRYDGYQSDIPVIDNVVGLNFEYYADPNPPQLRPGMIPATTYGPAPPGIGTDNPADSWGAGENCVFTNVGGTQGPRLAQLGSVNGGLVKLTAADLNDGPWCPDPAAEGRYDADLFRIRKVRVALRVQVADSSLRGPAGNGLFAKTGTSRGGERFVPDQEVRFDITPRNLNLGR
jgi:prepilin-type N-terminal cleavage/methylation domain-containing protein